MKLREPAAHEAKRVRPLRRAGAWVAGSLACGLLACAASSPDDGAGGGGGADVEDPELAPGVMTERAVWTLAWDLTGTEPLADGGRAFTTDLGYRVELTAGTAVVHSLTLWPCPAPSEASLWSLLVRPARAHEASDPSSLELGLAESLTGPLAPVELVGEFPPARYCDAHWLIGIPPQGEGPTTGRTSLALAGRWSRGATSGAFAIDTWWPQGMLATLPATPADATPRGVWIRMERVFARMLDGVELAAASDERIAGLALQNLVDHARVTIDVERP